MSPSSTMLPMYLNGEAYLLLRVLRNDLTKGLLARGKRLVELHGPRTGHHDLFSRFPVREPVFKLRAEIAQNRSVALQ